LGLDVTARPEQNGAARQPCEGNERRLQQGRAEVSFIGFNRVTLSPGIEDHCRRQEGSKGDGHGSQLAHDSNAISAHDLPLK
jgi:hypothetical protein